MFNIISLYIANFIGIPHTYLIKKNGTKNRHIGSMNDMHGVINILKYESIISRNGI